MAVGSRFRLALFDLDGTLTQPRSLWQYIHQALGLWEAQGFGFLARYQAGEIDYSTFCHLDAALWRGRSLAELRQIVQAVPFYFGADELLAYLKRQGLRLALISSGLTLLSDWVSDRFGFDFAIANELELADERLTGNVHIRVYPGHKGYWAEHLMEQWQIPPSEVIAFGDSPCDGDLFRLAGFAVAINPIADELKAMVDLCFTSENLASLIEHLPV